MEVVNAGAHVFCFLNRYGDFSEPKSPRKALIVNNRDFQIGRDALTMLHAYAGRSAIIIEDFMGI
jgi:hypothetical protein